MSCSQLRVIVCEDNIPMAESIANTIVHQVCYQGIERGGMLGMKDNVISSFFFDKEGSNHAKKQSYMPSKSLSAEIDHWNDNGILFVGLVHSHPDDAPYLSCRDIEFANAMLNQNPSLPSLRMYLVCHDELHRFLVSRKPTAQEEHWK